VFLIIGNLANPGRWSFATNVLCFSIAGTFFVWIPFMTPLTMFVFEVTIHMKDIEDFSKTLRRFEAAPGKELVRKAYFVLYRSLNATARRYTRIIPVWVGTIMFASAMNFLILLWPKSWLSPEEQEDLGESASILSTCVQTINMVIIVFLYYFVTQCNRQCRKVVPLTAQHASLIEVAQQAQICPLGIAPDLETNVLRCILALMISCATRFAFENVKVK
jgi:hypothetical protein